MMKSTLCAAVIGLSLTACDSNTNRTVSPSLPSSPPPAATSPSGVPPPSGGQTSATDEALEQRIATSLREDTALAAVAPNITIDANNGAVTLKGSVNSQQQRTDIEAKVRSLTGVTQVTNNLEISSASR
jgi:osmotically-inducible protein OsmY